MITKTSVMNTNTEPLEDSKPLGSTNTEPLEDSNPLGICTTNSYERKQWAELTQNEFQEKMRELGKVVTYRQSRFVNSPITLFGYTRDEIRKAYDYDLTVFNFHQAMEDVIRPRRYPYELEEGKTYDRYWFLDNDCLRAAYHEIGLSEDGQKGRWRYWEIDVLNHLPTSEVDKWRESLKWIKREVNTKLVITAVKIVEEGHWSRMDSATGLSKRKASIPKIGTMSARSNMRKGTFERANKFKQIKDENPHFSYEMVAKRANQEYGSVLGKIIRAHDVRNGYKAMGWSWNKNNNQ